ncbi:acyl-CoA-binding protein [Myriangium duriaei CBS 260.36]|uniref:Acyl-CoA-binding protein n=1 Tax=Myriangium duriaei CBS 260.36 TaxID=1168546 RepID=A0A9P4MHF8_9PEZI|nr:acyl-CoA-binding protein [Myriangium duriaei CBS 260.36]
MPAAQSPEFKKAVEDSRKLKAKPTDNELLELYAFFKQGSQETKFEETTAPGTFDFKGKAKYNAWKKVAEEKTSPQDAQKKYVALVNSLKSKYGYEG